MIKQAAMMTAVRRLPAPLKSLAKSVYFRGRHWAHGELKHIGTVQDLYYWVSNTNLDTLLLLQNYFSALYPDLDTNTHGAVTVYDKNGIKLGSKPFELGTNCCTKLRVSVLLEEFATGTAETFGTLEVHIAIPECVKIHINTNKKPFYFWDRFYIGYTTDLGQTCFMHGVDKTHIYRDGAQESIDWYKADQTWDWSPEIPINISEYKKFTVIMLNRTSTGSDVTLRLSDTNDRSLSWSHQIPAKGVRRFELNTEIVENLDPDELRMRLLGMATQYGRPVVFKEFSNGSISAMLCSILLPMSYSAIKRALPNVVKHPWQTAEKWYWRIKQLPHQNLKEIKMFKELLLCTGGRELRVFEWGAGTSTIYYTKFLREDGRSFKWFAMDNSKYWSERCRIDLMRLGLSDNVNVDCSPFPAYWERPGSSPGNPLIADELNDSAEVAVYVCKPNTLGGGFDVIFIDGRYRRRCLQSAQEALNPNGIVILHDAEREHYLSGTEVYPNVDLMLTGKTPGAATQSAVAFCANNNNPLIQRLKENNSDHWRTLR